MVEVDAEGVAGKVRLFEDAFLPEIIARKRKLCFLASSLHANLMALNGARAQKQGLVVGAATLCDAIELHGCEDFFVGSFRGGVVVDTRRAVGFPLIFGELRSAHHVDFAQGARCAIVAIVAHHGFAGFAALGGHQHYAVGTARPVNARGRSIFQHFQRGDILRVDVVDATCNRDTIDHVQRVVGGIDGPAAANAHRHAATRLAACLNNVDPGCSALQRLPGIGHRKLRYFLGGDRRNGPGGLAFLLGTVAHHHHVAKGTHIVLQGHVNLAFPVEIYGLSGHADKRKNEAGGSSWCFQ